ncbi:MAG: lipopolysaccharide assembly protein LapA domain-containing protein [Thermodesulfobacteriota bacterium]
MNAKLGLFVALLLGVVVFTLQNTESVDIRFFFWQLSLSRALLIFLVFAIGILFGYLLATLQAGRISGEKRDMIEPPTGGGG